ncbi:sulfur carrier protein ThiS [Polycladomyces subterraneus]|uniref:Sulfur carrier protein ThiS n=1 Tax=Polycladomyces subterraneus TaxID=1016997 RepID=A0ABT8IPY9_9BACL|nr:sulfur carrier protein ThiS [Polycladomyces subterraneus]MDN4594843.1 sulfur carrier protein ThiS [Polycladomyces subterraneus]
MRIQLNGQPYDLPAEVDTVERLIQHLQLEQRIVVVEHNQHVLEKEDHPSAVLHEGDVLEIVHFVGGG